MVDMDAIRYHVGQIRKYLFELDEGVDVVENILRHIREIKDIFADEQGV